MHKLNIRTALPIAAMISVMGSLPSHAFTLTSTSATFDNTLLENGKVVGKAATNSNFANYEQAEFNDSSDNYVEYIEFDGVSQVRWGDPVYSNTNKHFEGGSNYVEEYGSYRVTDGSSTSYYGWHKDYTAKKSGLGFAGISDVTLEVGKIFNIGTLKHYNNTIWSNGLIGVKSDFSLGLDFGDSELGQQTFDFALNIDETSNNPSNHAGNVCPYETVGYGCSDKITWDFALDSESSFEYEGDTYTLELVGFNDTPDFDSSAVTDFISQEQGTSEANLFARIIKLGDYSDEPSQVPEPGTALGLLAIGLLVTKLSSQSETIAAKR